MEYQFIEYVESTGKDTSTMTEEELDAMRDSFLNGNFTHQSNDFLSLNQLMKNIIT